jgi:hypothetical protein
MDTYRRRSLTAVRLDAERSAALPSGHGEVVSVATLAIELLEACTSFRTLEEHAEKIALARKLPDEARGVIHGLLAELAGSGFLVSKTTLLERSHGANASAHPPPIEAVCIATRERPAAVERCILSYVANMRSYGRHPTWTILDSSPDPEACRLTRERLAPLALDGVALRYACVDDKAAFAERLAEKAGVDPDIVRFALFDVDGMGHDTGSNRNALLLAHAGQMLFSVDDDTVCELRTAGRLADEDVELTTFHGGDYTVFKSLDEARATLAAVDADILGAHQEFLGKSLGACLGDRQPKDVVTDGLTDEGVEAILAGTARVGATFGGFFGDCASTSPALHLFCHGARPDDLPKDPAAYRNVVASRQVLRAPRRPTFSQGASLMAASYAVDLREPCPPFFPTRRAQDHVFGTLMRRCFGDRFFGFLPLSIGHLPIAARSADPDDLWGTARPKLATLVHAAIQLVPLELVRPGAPRLRALGRQLSELGSLPWRDFERLLLRSTWQILTNDIRLVQDRLSQISPSSPWADDARRYRDALFGALASENLVVPEGLRANRSLDDARVLLQRQIRRFGELLSIWPEVFGAAQRLREDGVILGQPLRGLPT